MPDNSIILPTGVCQRLPKGNTHNVSPIEIPHTNVPHIHPAITAVPRFQRHSRRPVFKEKISRLFPVAKGSVIPLNAMNTLAKIPSRVQNKGSCCPRKRKNPWTSGTKKALARPSAGSLLKQAQTFQNRP